MNASPAGPDHDRKMQLRTVFLTTKMLNRLVGPGKEVVKYGILEKG